MTVSVVIPVYNSAPTLKRCLAAVCASRYSDYECIVVDDGSTDGSGEIARSFPVRVVEVAAGPRGSAAARNRGAEAAHGDILLFVDADVVVRSDTVSKVAAAFAEPSEVDAFFGSYDDRPTDSGFLSQYKNLTHHFVHQHAREDAPTFWSGCGAIRRDAFAAVGGFDEVRYSRSSIEDIELGYRLNASGRRVRVNKQIQVQHLKRWTLKGMVTSDIWGRALPWTRAILEHRTLPNDLNLRISQRLCALLMCLLVVYLSAVPFFRPAALVPIVLLLLLTGVFVLTIGSWSGDVPHFQPGRWTRAVAAILVGAAVGLSLHAGHWPAAVLVAALVCAMAVDRWLPRRRRPPERVLFGVAVLSLVAAAGVLVASLSWPVAAPMLGAVLLVVLINHRIFAFFLRKRGGLFALASVPFYLVYYLYGVAAFLAGVALYVLEPPRAGRRLILTLPARSEPDTTAATGIADLTKRPPVEH